MILGMANVRSYPHSRFLVTRRLVDGALGKIWAASTEASFFPITPRQMNSVRSHHRGPGPQTKHDIELAHARQRMLITRERRKTAAWRRRRNMLLTFTFLALLCVSMVATGAIPPEVHGLLGFLI